MGCASRPRGLTTQGRRRADGYLLHFSKDSIRDYLTTQNRYTSLEAEQAVVDGVPMPKFRFRESSAPFLIYTFTRELATGRLTDHAAVLAHNFLLGKTLGNRDESGRICLISLALSGSNASRLFSSFVCRRFHHHDLSAISGQRVVVGQSGAHQSDQSGQAVHQRLYAGS
jgi:hypothetical protein